MSLFFACRLLVLTLLALSPAVLVCAAEDEPSSPAASVLELPQIADEPKTIDPATLMPSRLAVSATVDFSDSSLREVVDWLQNEQKIVVLLEKAALADIGVAPSEPVSDRLDDAPIYLLLNRLRSLKLAWYFEDDILHITSVDVARERLTTLPHNIGDLLDAGYESENLGQVIESTIHPEQWETIGGVGALSFLGDVMFVRQTGRIQREVEGLLATLRKHARQTFILDPVQHLALRQGLERKLDVAFLDTPLETAASQLANDAKIDIRLDVPALRELRVREREPVTLKLTDQKLKTVLQAMLMDLELTWILQDGVLWITTTERAQSFQKTAVYDVRDLCRDWAESEALEEAVISQTAGDLWNAYGGPGSITSARPGILVIHNQEQVLMDVLDLLETYRTALRSSKPRVRDVVDPKEVTTVYYRLHANVATGLLLLLPRLVEPESWTSDARADAPGQILIAPSSPDLFDEKGQMARAASGDKPGSAETLVVARAVLIIRQTREAHDEIAKVIRRIESGDMTKGAGGMGMGGGGFGGGFFSIPPSPVHHGDKD